jgi:hypothetical protein
MYERRSERRMKALKAGKILLSEWLSVNCTVRDMSSAGARLELETAVMLPSEFRLHILSADLVIPAAAVWQRRLEAGIRFTGVGVIGKVDDMPEWLELPAA